MAGLFRFTFKELPVSEYHAPVSNSVLGISPSQLPQGKLVFNCNYHMTTEEQNLDQFVISEVAFVAPGEADNMAFTTDFGNLDYVSIVKT